jgi:HTH-type transcriptional regulator/antitoxin HigA
MRREIAMEIRPLRTEADYKAALEAVAPYFDLEPEPGSEEGDRFEILLMVIEAYEAKHHAIDTPDPVEAIKFRMEQAELTPKDLRPMIGQVNRVYEVLNYTRPLTLPMIRRLSVSLGISADALIGEQKIHRAVASKSRMAVRGKVVKQVKPGGGTKSNSVKPTRSGQRKSH